MIINDNIVKFVHLLCTMGLLGSTFFCLMLSLRGVFLNYINNIMLCLALGAMISGTLLIYPKQFTFETPWIRAAYLLFTSYCFVTLFLIHLKKKRALYRWNGLITYGLLMTILVLIVHDAVTKSTFLL